MQFDAERPDTVPSLSAAARAGDLMKVEELLGKGRSPAATDNRGWTTIHSCAAFKQLAALKLVLGHHRKRREDVANLCTWTNETPLMLACNMDSINVEILEILVSEGARVDAVNVQGYSALHFACHFKNNLPAVQFLVQNKAKVNLNELMNGYTPLHFAIEYSRDDDLVEYLAEETDLGIKNVLDMTPLFLACYKTYYNAVDIILKKSRTEINQPANVFTPLAISVERDSLKIVKLLLENYADPNRTTSDGKLAIHYAVDDPEIFRILLPLTSPSLLEGNDETFFAHVLFECRTISQFEILLQHRFTAESSEIREVSVEELIDYIDDYNLFNESESVITKFQNIFKYCFYCVPEDAFRHYIQFCLEKNFSVDFLLLLCRMGIPHHEEVTVIYKEAVIQKLEKLESSKRDAARITDTLKIPVLSLKQLSRNAARKYIRDSVIRDWDAYEMVQNSSLPKEIKKYLGYEILD